MSTTALKMQHTSLQFSDSPKQQEFDIRLVFTDAIEFPIKTGTEAGPDKPGHNANRDLLVEYAEKHNHVLHFARDNWVAVDRDIIKKGSVERGEVFVVDGDKTKGPGHDSVMATVAFDHVDEGVGRIHQGAVHYPTKGRTPHDPNWKWNRLYAQRIEEWMREEGRGRDLAFLNGDFNMVDNRESQDWAFGGPFTSMADELKAWETSGHGPIDGFCSYDKDGRVEARRFNVLNDQEEFRFSDHYVCRGVWTVKHLKPA